jgi:hypothetical protein
VEVNKTMDEKNEGVPDKLMDIFLLSSPGIINHMNRQVGAPDLVFPQSYWTILNKQEIIIHNSVTRPVQYSLSTMPTMSTIYDKPGAGWNRNQYWKLLQILFQNEWNRWCGTTRKHLQHHDSLKRITFNWWQWGILKLFAQNQMKGHLFFNVWWMNMTRAMPLFEQSIQNCSKMILTSLRQVRNWWYACRLNSIMGWRIRNGLILTTNGWSSWWSIWRKLNQATSNRSDL